MKTVPMNPELYAYVSSHCPKVSDVLNSVRDYTSKIPGANMQIGHDQGAFMATVVKTIRAKRILEIGCFTGYSAICMASALAPNCQLITLDVSKEYTDVAKQFFAIAGLDQRIEVRLGPALEALKTIKTEFGNESFDLIFIDADKENILRYYEEALALLRPTGVILVDNVLWSGHVIDKSHQDDSTRAIRAFNDFVCADSRVDANMLTIGDGIMWIIKR